MPFAREGRIVDDQIDDWIAHFPGGVAHPFKLRPAGLYTIDQLYDVYDRHDPASWSATYDQQCYRWFYDSRNNQPRPLGTGEAIAARIHDAEIEHGVDTFLKTNPSRVIGFMGGHDTLRADPAFAQVAAMARSLRRKGFTIVTGGGPGLMEAANFGAFLAGFNDDQLDTQLAVLREEEMSNGAAGWINSACQVRINLLGEWRTPALSPLSENLGIPTWLYGSEPPNLFATHIAKYFYNSVREDGLVSIASGGLVFAPGSAGTVQEVFQDMTINYYTAGNPTPMVFLGKNFWDPDAYDPPRNPPGGHSKPVYPLVERMARDRGHGGDLTKMLLIEDDPDAIIAFLERVNKRPDSSGSFAQDRLRHRLNARTTL
jgi:predicted Rossmann-fold nucleotide-binding protein